MDTAKNNLPRLLNSLTDEISCEAIQYHIYVREQIERGRQDIRDGKLLSQEEAERRTSRWLDE